MTFGSVCSGIEAASAAWCLPDPATGASLGWRCGFVSEIEPFPCSVLAHRFPEVPNLGDMTRYKEWPERYGIATGSIDLLVGGTPCQAFSVAGLRKGLDDPRGNLTLVFLGLLDLLRPRWVVWENVPGVLSIDGGRVFGAFLGGLGKLGYGWAYRILDAQYFGVAQRRRRVFVVGHLGSRARAFAVLFERDCLSGNPPPRRGQGQGPAAGFEVGPGGGGFSDLAPTLDARCKDGPIRNQIVCGVAEVAGSLPARATPNGHGASGVNSQDASSGHLIPVPTGRALSMTPSEPSAPTPTPAATADRTPTPDASSRLPPVATFWYGSQVCQTLDAVLRKGQAMPERNLFPAVLVPADPDPAVPDRATPPPTPPGGDFGDAPIPFDETQATSPGNYSNPQAGDPCHPLASGARPPAIAHPVHQSGKGFWSEGFGTLRAREQDSHENLVAFSCKDHGQDAAQESAPTLRAMGHAGTHPNGGGQVAVAFSCRSRGDDGRGYDRPPQVFDGGCCGAIDATKPHAVAFQPGNLSRGAGPAPSSEAFPTLKSDNGRGRSDQDPCVALAFGGQMSTPQVDVDLSQSLQAKNPQAVAFQPRVARNGRGLTGETVNALQAHSGGTGKGDAAPCVATSFAVRRLTPRECERLQGFPDDWTLVPHNGKPACDGPRYKAMGNSMAVPVMRWIGRRIAEVDAIHADPSDPTDPSDQSAPNPPKGAATP